MDPREQFCHNPTCWAYGRRGEGHVRIHSQRERRYHCKRCGKTFGAMTGTRSYRALLPHALVVQLVTLLAHGCPVQAIVAACGLDQRTVARYQAAAGVRCRRIHEYLVEAGRVTLGQVQVDELRVRLGDRVVWLATALTVTSRLGLGRAVSVHGDRTLLPRARVGGPTRAVLGCADGLSSYVAQAGRVFREAVRSGQAARPRLVPPDGVMIAKMAKMYAQRRIVGVVQRVPQGPVEAVQAQLTATQGATEALLNKATSSGSTPPSGRTSAPSYGGRGRRRGRWPRWRRGCGSWALATTSAGPTTASASGAVRRTRRGSKWVVRTPAQAARLTDHR